MELFNKPLSQITLADIQTIVQDKVPESRYLDYKLELHPMTDGGNKEFLKDIGAFANTIGGYLIYGIDEQEGVPKKIIGVEIKDFDKLRLHFENLLRTGVSPKIVGTDFAAVGIKGSQKIIIIKIPKSLTRPHMVTVKNHSRFYARNSAGTYQLDVDDLRKLFLESESLSTRIRNFRDERLSNIVANLTPVPLLDGGKIVLHLIPVSAFEIGTKYNLADINTGSVPPIYASGWNHRYNFDGFISYDSDSDRKIASTYTQVYHNGIIEAVDTRLLRIREDKKGIPSKALEIRIVDSLNKYNALLSHLGVNCPLWICLSLLGVKNYWLWVDNRWLDDAYTIDRDELITPEVQLESFTEDAAQVLRPIFDSIWQACGYKRSFSYDENGNWNLKGK